MKMLRRVLAILCRFAGCFNENAEERRLPTICSDEEHNRIYNEAADLISPYMRLHGVSEKPVNTATAQRELRRGISLLQTVTAYAPNNWSAHWITGKAFQALRERQPACDAFKRAFDIQRSNADVAREYMHECLELGYSNEAVLAAQGAVSLRSSDAGLQANLALAQLIAGDPPAALKSIEGSLHLDPSDKISQQLKTRIQEVINGKRPQPRTLRELGR